MSAHCVPFVSGGPADLGTIASLYRTLREFGDLRGHEPRWRSLCAAVRIDWAAWRYSRAAQR